MTDAWRATLFLGVVFFALGVILPYLPVWLEAVRGLSGAQIGLALFGASLGRLVTGPFVGAWAEKRTGRNVAIRMSLAATAAYLLMQAAPNAITLIAAGFIAQSVVWSLMPIGEAMLLLTEGPPSFGMGRAIGSATFVGGVFLGGWLKDAAGPQVIAPVVTLIYAGAVAASLFGPKAPMGDISGGLSFSERLRKGLRLYSRPTLLFLLLSTGPLQATHAFYYGYSVIIWQEQGFSGLTTSALWSTGVAVEILLMTTASAWSRLITPQRLILYGAIGSIIRWAALAQAPDLPAAFALQTLHALSFAAVYLGGVQIIDRDVARDDKTAAMSLHAALTSGAFTGVAGISAGVIYDAMQVRGYWVMSGVAMIGCLFAILLMWRIAIRPKRAKPPSIGE